MSTPSLPDTSLLVVVNPLAGAIKGLDAALAVLRAGRRPVAVVELSDRRQVDELLRHVGSGTLVAAGGDGTLHLLVQQLWRLGLLSATTLGLLPLGTGNDLARAVRIPLDPEAAAAAIVSGRPCLLDLLVDDAGTVAINAVHGGVGGAAVRSASRLKPVLGRLAYRLGAVWAGGRAPGWQLRVELDGRLLAEGRTLFVGIGNGSTIGGGTVLWPRAAPDDGLAEVVVAPAFGPLSRLRLLAALRSGDVADADGVVFGQGRSVGVRGQPIPYVLDGELSPPSSGRSWRIHPAAWRLLVPVEG